MKKNENLTCFKYRSLASAKQCLEENTLYFAKPDSLNDMLEAKYDSASYKDFYKLAGDVYSEVSFKKTGVKLSLSHIKEDELKELIEANTEEDNRFRDFTEQVGIFSSASRPNDQAMWAYYADNCEGVCFQLEWSSKLLHEHQIIRTNVQYTDTARIINRAEDLKIMFDRVVADYPDATLDELHKISLTEEYSRYYGILSASRAVSIKHTDWKHEDEIRLIKPKYGALPILTDTLKYIHIFTKDKLVFGKTEKEILDIILVKYPSVKIIRWSFDHGAIFAMPSELRVVDLKGNPI